MKRSGLAIAGVLVLVVAIGLLLWPGATDDEQLPSQPAKGAESEVATPTVLEPTAGPTGSSDNPADPADADPPVRSDGVREYTVGGVRVRDHRKGDHPKLDVPPNIHPPGGRKIASTLTSDLAQLARAVMNECVAKIPKEARGGSPRLEGQITIAIRDKQVTVTAATMQLREVVGASSDEAKQCIEQRSLGITAPADEADLSGYTINLSFAVP